MQLIHVSDVHANRERIEAVRTVFDCLYKTVERHNVELVLFAGDFWDATITNTKASGFTEYVAMVSRLRSMCEVMFIYGTPRHEPKGSLDIFASIGCTVVDTPRRMAVSLPSGDIDILAIPEPRKGDYAGVSQDETVRMITASFQALSAEKRGANPFLVAYHGEVSGAVYQNGVEAKSSIRFPSNLLAAMNADYYALGHIHMPQSPFDKAYYPGSPAPLDFGESHDGMVHLVEFGDKVEVTKIPTQAPRFVTIEIDSSAVNGFDPSPYTGNHLRLVVTNGCDDDIPHAIASSIRSRAGVLSCKVIVLRDMVSTERSKAISQRRTALEKYEEYCKITKRKVTPHAADLVRSMDESQNIQSSHPSKSFELLSISLRGAIGVKCGSGQDDVYIDFSKFHKGVVAMVGDNGRGKTTIIENCHPYPRMLTRKKTLREHFCLKDSHRILVYRSNDGLYHKIVMSIDAKTKSGSTTYFAYTSRDGSKWTPVIDTDGSLEAYNEYVERTFGSLELFIRTSFFTRKETRGTPDLTNATKGEKIEFFSSLAGNDWLSEIAERAKLEISSLEEEMGKLSVELDKAEAAKGEIDECECMLEELEASRAELHSMSLDASKEAKKLEEYETERMRQEVEARNRAILKSQLSDNLNNIEERMEGLQNDAAIFKVVSEFRAELDRLDAINDIYPKIVDELSSTVKRKMDLSPQMSQEQNDIATLNESISFLRMSMREIEGDIKMHESQSVDFYGLCPVCGAELTDEQALDIQGAIKGHKDEADFLRGKLKDVQTRLDADLEELRRHIQVLDKLTSDIDTIDVQIMEAQAKKDSIDNEIEGIAAAIRNSTDIPYHVICERSGMMADPSEALHELASKKSDIECQLATIKDILPGPSREPELHQARERLELARLQISEIDGQTKAIKSRIKRLHVQADTMDDIMNAMSVLDDKMKAYSHVQASFSRTGIPLMELESAIPDIASMANDILEKSYGDRFTVSFETIRQGKRKSVDDLNIVVYDSQQGMSKYLDMVCSGEEVWIKQALFYAFSIVRMNRTGFSFMTRFIDESDSSLDTSSRVRYLRMIEEAHRLAGARLSVLITHSQEIKDVAEQVIEI